MAAVTQAMVDAAIEKMKAANLRLQRAVEKSPSDRTRRGQHISIWNEHESRIHKLYAAYDKARDEAARLKRELRENGTANPAALHGTVHDIPSTWTPVMVKRIGNRVQIKMRGK
jgi:hypothetical protein